MMAEPDERRTVRQYLDRSWNRRLQSEGVAPTGPAGTTPGDDLAAVDELRRSANIARVIEHFGRLQ